MSYKRTLVFLLVFAALGSFFYFYEVRGGRTREEAEERAKHVVSVKPEEVTGISITRPNERVSVTKDKDAWVITDPVTGPADRHKVDELVRAVADLKFERNLGEQPKLDSFGLDTEKAVKVQVKGSGGELGSILIGSQTPDGKNFYVKSEGAKDVYTAAASVKNQLDQDLFALRDKKLVQILTPDVTAVSLSQGAHTLAFEKSSGNEWMLTAPEAYDADNEKVLDLVNSFTSTRIKKFMEENASDMKQYGLDKPAVLVKLNQGEQQTTIALGDKPGIDKDSIYATVGDSHRVVEIDGAILKKISASPDEWRDMHLTKMDPAEVGRLEIEKPEGKLALEQDDSGNWTMPQPQKIAADNERVDSLVRDISGAKATGFAKEKTLKEAKAKLEKPEIQVRLWKKKEEQPVVLSFAANGDNWVALTQSGDVSYVASETVKKFSVKPDDVKDKSVLRFSAADIDSIEFVRNQKKYVVKRKDIQWDVPRGLKMQSMDIDQLLWDLHRLKYLNKEDRNNSDATYGFDSPALEMKMSQAEGKEPHTLVIGKKFAEPDVYYAHDDTASQVMVVEWKDLADYLDKL